MTNDRDRQALIEEAAGAYRPRRAGGVGSHPAWHDLDAGGRKAVFETTGFNRVVEAALDPDGLSGTAHAVLRRLRPTPDWP